MIESDLAVQHHFTQLGDLRMHWVEAGAGPVVVLLHGFPEMWWSWRHQIQALAEAGYRVIAPDQRGYNDTDKHGPYDLGTLVGDVAKLIESLGLPADQQKVRIVGHDWGGAVAWHLAASRPDLCEKLVVLNCPHPAIMRFGIFKPRQLKKSWYFFFFMTPALPELVLLKDDAHQLVRVLKGNATDRTHFGDEELEPFRQAFLKPGAASAMIGWYRASLKQLVKPVTAPTIAAETLLIWGMSDIALGFDDLVPGTEKYAPKLTVKKIENAGHFLQSEAPAAVNQALLDFL